jgi:Na+-driven multidrug efflux pump
LKSELPGGSLGLTWAGLAPADRASFAWRLPSFDHLVGLREQRGRHIEAERLCGLEIENKAKAGRLLERPAAFTPLSLEILRVGAPMSLQPILNNLALATLTGFVGTLGAAQLAGFGVAVRLEYLLYPLTFGLGAGVLAMVGTNIGAGNFARAGRIAWTAAALAAGVTGCVGLFGAMSPGIWTGLFTKVPGVHVPAAGYLVIVSLAYPFLGWGLTFASAFQAAGRPLWPLLGITSRALVVAGGGWIAVHLTGTGLSGLAVVAASGSVVYGASLAIAFRVGV